jgi:hypothetical protein
MTFSKEQEGELTVLTLRLAQALYDLTKNNIQTFDEMMATIRDLTASVEKLEDRVGHIEQRLNIGDYSKDS